MSKQEFTKEELEILKNIVVERIRESEKKRDAQLLVQKIIRRELQEAWDSLYKINRIKMQMEREEVTK